jgi:hypothetical protein
MSAESVQALLRFLSQDAKIPLATAISKTKELQSADLGSADKIAKSKVDVVQAIFPDDKHAKQILSAAKRVVKKRAAEDGSVDSKPATKKNKRTADSMFEIKEDLSPSAIEELLTLPTSDLSEDGLSKVTLITNRAPLVLAFVVTLLKYSMPEQPLSSRLSLAQAYVSITSRSRAVSLGIESGKSAEEEGHGAGLPVIAIMGKDIRVIRRYDYDWKEPSETTKKVKTEAADEKDAKNPSSPPTSVESPLWAIDLEATKQASNSSSRPAGVRDSNLPIYTPQSARAYLMKSFSSPSDDEDSNTQKKPTAAAKLQTKADNLGKLLKCLELLYDSWSSSLSAEELDGRTWGWYAQVRPSIKDGVAGWGEKEGMSLGDILNLRPRR